MRDLILLLSFLLLLLLSLLFESSSEEEDMMKAACVLDSLSAPRTSFDQSLGRAHKNRACLILTLQCSSILACCVDSSVGCSFLLLANTAAASMGGCSIHFCAVVTPLRPIPPPSNDARRPGKMTKIMTFDIFLDTLRRPPRRGRGAREEVHFAVYSLLRYS